MGIFSKKRRQVTPRDDRAQVGDQWSFVAIGPETKLIPVLRVGKRDMLAPIGFVEDLAARLTNRVQLWSEGLLAYVEVIEQAFGGDVDYGQVDKIFDAAPAGAGGSSHLS